MILEYHRPKTVEAALELLARENPPTRPLAGGATLNQPSREAFAVVDLQDLSLDGVRRSGTILEIGATTTLQALLQFTDLPVELHALIGLEATYNLRQVGTVAGTLVSADGRSPLTTGFLSLDARLVLLPGADEIFLGDLLPRRQARLNGRLISQVTIPLNVRLAYEYVARTPADRPLVCVAAASWPSGRTRVALGGFGSAPLLAFDGPSPDGAEFAAHDAYSQAGDLWASADYRREMAAVLTKRALSALRVTIADP